MAVPLTQDTTYQTAGYMRENSATPEGTPWGTGIQIRYIVSSDKIQIELADGRTFDFGNTQGAGKPFAASGFLQNDYQDGWGRELLWLGAPVVDGVALSYLRTASFADNGEDGGGDEFFASVVFGNETKAMPAAGTATYSVVVGGGGEVDGVSHNFSTNSTATFSADFAAGTVTTLLHLIGEPSAGGPSTDLGEFQGNGAISSAAFEGTFGAAAGGFWGSFFGPQAQEVGYAFFLEQGSRDVRGLVAGRKD